MNPKDDLGDRLASLIADEERLLKIIRKEPIELVRVSKSIQRGKE
jgi:hypothetical protein